MPESPPAIDPRAPFGTQPRRSPALLWLIIAVLVPWLVFLAWLAWRYPARP